MASYRYIVALTGLAACSGGTISDRLVDASDTVDINACAARPMALADPAPLRRLSQSELTRTLLDLGERLGVRDLEPGPSAFPDPGVGDYFSNNALQNTVSQLTANQLMDAAERVSEQLTNDMPALLGCTPSAPGCIDGFIRRYADLVFQRPPSTDEVAGFQRAYDAVRAVGDVRAGVRAVIELGIQSPDFVYIVADVLPDENGRLRFNGHSVARRLSYFLWGTMPDATLRAAADADALSTPDQLRAQALRMLDDPRARATLRRFHREWLAVKDPETMQKSTEVFPEFTTDLARDLASELDAFVDRVVWDDGGGIAQLLTDRGALVNARLAAFYGVDSPASGNSDWRYVTLGDERRGILTRGAYLASNASATGTSPVKRGVAILAKVLCTTLTPPDDVDISLPSPEPGEQPRTKKEIFAAHAAETRCAACHSQIDPLGFAFEIYDGIGSYETTYANGEPVESAGRLTDGRAFADATELIDHLATDTDVAQCYAKRWLEWSMGRSATAEERCGIARLATTATTSIRSAIIELASSDLMLYATEARP